MLRRDSEVRKALQMHAQGALLPILTGYLTELIIHFMIGRRGPACFHRRSALDLRDAHAPTLPWRCARACLQMHMHRLHSRGSDSVHAPTHRRIIQEELQFKAPSFNAPANPFSARSLRARRSRSCTYQHMKGRRMRSMAHERRSTGVCGQPNGAGCACASKTRTRPRCSNTALLVAAVVTAIGAGCSAINPDTGKKRAPVSADRPGSWFAGFFGGGGWDDADEAEAAGERLLLSAFLPYLCSVGAIRIHL